VQESVLLPPLVQVFLFVAGVLDAQLSFFLSLTY
jgi:hypothetical protein